MNIATTSGLLQHIARKILDNFENDVYYEFAFWEAEFNGLNTNRFDSFEDEVTFAGEPLYIRITFERTIVQFVNEHEDDDDYDIMTAEEQRLASALDYYAVMDAVQELFEEDLENWLAEQEFRTTHYYD